jgi:uncharacterized membrane protein
MFHMVPMPAWDGLHPLIIHFPIALLFVAPLFILLGAFVSPPKGRPLLYSALLLMVLGTVSTFFAVGTGEAAGKIAERTPEINAALEHHENLAENTRLTFSILTVIFAGVLFLPAVRHRELGRITSTVVTLVFLAVYGGGMLMLANTADQGGRLVHEMGVHALVAPVAAQAPVANVEKD